jgi:murein DD-endopeptidase MepM/ murein hydrolase activator NlpD
VPRFNIRQARQTLLQAAKLRKAKCLGASVLLVAGVIVSASLAAHLAAPPALTPLAVLAPTRAIAPLAVATPSALPFQFHEINPPIRLHQINPPTPEPALPDQARFSEERAHLAKLRQAGLDPEKLLRRASREAEGGPFVALGSMDMAPQGDDRLALLRSILKTMPFAAPLVDYQIGSPFGPRRDPFNGRLAYHTGLDLEAPFRSPVFSTAPGQIIFVGIKDAYGFCIDIDHGNGLVTRYAHLDRILVSPGQFVGAHQQIAELGSTGRSTGPHLHYEVLFDHRPQDPAKFLKAGAALKPIAY